MKTKIKWLIIVIATIIISLFVAEFAVRTWAPQDLISDIIALDGDLCHRLKRNATGVQNSREFSINLKTNALGLRDRNYTKEKNDSTYRILILGDSQTFGWGVKLKNIFPKVIEQDLNLNPGKLKYEVINGGVYGYGTVHQFKFLRKYGYQMDPDLVIIAMDFLHDIEKNNEAHYVLEGDQLLRSNRACFAQRSRAMTRYLPFSSFLRGHSHLFRYVGPKILKLKSKLFSTNGSRNNIANQTNKYDLENTEEIFRRLRAELINRGIKFAVVILPEFGSLKKEFEIGPNFWKILNSFEDFLLKEDIPFLSMQESFQQYPDSRSLTFKYSHHFNPKGHRFIAQQIEEFLHERRLLVER